MFLGRGYLLVRGLYILSLSFTDKVLLSPPHINSGTLPLHQICTAFLPSPKSPKSPKSPDEANMPSPRPHRADHPAHPAQHPGYYTARVGIQTPATATFPHQPHLSVLLLTCENVSTLLLSPDYPFNTYLPKLNPDAMRDPSILIM